MSLPHTAELAATIEPAAADGFALSVADYKRSLEDPRVKRIEKLVHCEVNSQLEARYHGRSGTGPRHHHHDRPQQALRLRAVAQGQPVSALQP